MRVTSRVRKAEKWVSQHEPEPVIVLAEMPDGTYEELTVDEYIERGAVFFKEVRGNNLNDIKRLLDTFHSCID